MDIKKALTILSESGYSLRKELAVLGSDVRNEQLIEIADKAGIEYETTTAGNVIKISYYDATKYQNTAQDLGYRTWIENGKLVIFNKD